jgi:two-component sensor histidine kinase
MLLLACGSGIVAVAAAVFIGWLSYKEYRDRIGDNLIAASRAIMIAVDSELDEPLAFVNGLSVSSNFIRGDFEALRKQASDVLSPYGYELIVTSSDGAREYLNTGKSFGARTAGTPAASHLRLGKAGNAHLRRVEDRWMAWVDVPIKDDSGATPYTLSIGIPNGLFQRLLLEQNLPASWSPVILDADWTIVARGISPERFVGNKGGGLEFRNAPADQTHEVRVLEGQAALSAHSHSGRSGWTTAVAISEADLFKQAIGPVALAAFGGFIATALLIAIAAVLATYLATAIKTLAIRGFPESVLAHKPSFRLSELALVARGLHEAAVTVLDNRKQLGTEIEDMRRLDELSSFIAREENKFDVCLAEITKTAIVISGADKGNMQLFDSVSHSLKIAAHHGFEQEFLKFFGNVDDHAAAACGLAMASNEQVIVSDVLTSDIFVGKPAQKVLLDSDVRAVVSTPLRSSKASLLGIISTHFGRPGKPGERQLRLLSILARQAADYLERKQAEQIQHTILRELQHRSNNLLAVIQSIAHRSLDGDQSLAAGKAAFEARLQALARANRALLRSNWAGVDLAQLVRGELEAFSRRAVITGVSVILSPQQAQNFALALHELATNSTKYGALSSPKGKLAVSWTIVPNENGSLLKFRWEETGGPRVSPPIRHGFGTQLLKGVFSDARLDYPIEGMKCEIDVHLFSAARPAILELPQAETLATMS